jgi:hypothetical protein
MQSMQLDLTLIPTTLDIVHVALAAALLLMMLAFILLALISASVNRRVATLKAAAAQPVAVPARVEPQSQPVAARPTPAEPVVIRESSPDAALQLLGLLQKEARYIDFVQENIAGHADADIGAAVRIVHEGCRKVLQQHLELVPVRSESENARITLPRGFDPSAVRVTGNIVGEPPFSGTLIHRGWRVARINLPKVAEGHDVRVLAEAEVEL